MDEIISSDIEDMSSATFQAIYDGEALRAHKIDVEQLAPALLALGEMVREANAVINGGRSKVKLLVKADHDNLCFDIGFELVQTIYRQIQTILGDEGVKNAKDLLEWLGIIGCPSLGLLAYMKLKKGRKVADVKQITDEDKRGMVSVQFEGDDNRVEIHNYVLDLSQNNKIQAATAGVLAPLRTEGINNLEFRSETSENVKYNKEDATEIEASCGTDDVKELYEPQVIEAHLKVYSSVFDKDAERWRFNYSGDVIWADITETNIEKNTLERGFVSVGDIYKVRLEITEYRTTHQIRKKYRILEVLDFMPARKHPDLFDTGGDDGAR